MRKFLFYLGIKIASLSGVKYGYFYNLQNVLKLPDQKELIKIEFILNNGEDLVDKQVVWRVPLK